MVIRELTESDLQPTTRSAGNRCKIDRFPILNAGECDVHNDPKHGQGGLLVQKLCNISGGGHFKEKQALSLTDQQIKFDDKGSDFQAIFQDFFAQYQNPQLTGDIAMAKKAWNSWKTTPFDWWQCQLNFAVCAPPPDVASRLRTASKPQIRSSEVSTPFTPTSPLDVFLRSCESPFLEKNPILGMRTPTMPGLQAALHRVRSGT